MFRLIFLADDWSQLEAHLISNSPEEDGAFFLVQPGKGSSDTRLLGSHIFFPPHDGWESKGNHRLRPSGQWLSSVVGSAIEEACGIGFVHSHPDAFHPAALSPIDRQTSLEWAQTLSPMTNGPFVSIVWANGKAAGWVFPDVHQEPVDVGRVIVAGQGGIQIKGDAGGSVEIEMDDRQIRALGEVNNANLRGLTVGLVGAGGTGSPAAEQLVRMGVAKLNIFDPDVIDSVSNLRRVVGARPKDFEQSRSKATVLKEHVDSLGLQTETKAFPFDIREESAARALLDSDVVISTTDTQSSRSFINQLAYQYWLPVIDVGVRVGMTVDRKVSGMPIETRLLLGDDGCLWCRGALSSDLIREENLPPDERAALAIEGYVQGVQGPQPSLAPLNFLASSIATMSLLRCLAGDNPQSNSFIADLWERYIQPLASDRTDDCVCRSWRGRADAVYVPFKPSTEM